VAIAAAAACSGGDGEGDGAERGTTEARSGPSTTSSPTTETSTTAASTTTDTTTTTTRPPTPEGQITVDYLAYWAAYDRLAADPGRDTDVLAEHASGQALESARQEIANLRSQGRRIEVGPVDEHNAYGPAVIDAGTAYVADCHVADARVLDAGGEVVRREPAEGRPETIAVTLVRGADRWLVESLVYYDLAPGETCSASGPVAG
jgi:hypothetical protein